MEHPKLLTHAKSMRHNPTSAEQRLWGYLRGRRLGGYKFVRQMPISNFIADFVCREFSLIIEVDGATHGDASDVAYDQRRSMILHKLGYSIFRVDNQDVYDHLTDVLD